MSAVARLRAAARWLLATRVRRLTAAAVAAAVVVAVVAGVALRPDGDQLTDRVAHAVQRPDPLPKGPVVTSIPPDCGVKEATVDRLVGAASGQENTWGPDSQQCSWDAQYVSFGSSDLQLVAQVNKYHERTARHERVAAAVRAYAELVGGAHGEVSPVDGLGTRAASWIDRATFVAFWQGNTVATVSYGGGPAQDKPLSATAARAGALRAAADVARGMHLTVTGTPKLGAGTDRKASTVPDACDVLPASIVDELGDQESRSDEDSDLFADDQQSDGDGCRWGYGLKVEVDGAARGPGTSEEAAALRYLQLYATARASRPDADVDGAQTSTVPVRGIGDEAYLQYTRDNLSDGVVVFRVRDVLVRVTVSADSPDLSRRDAFDALYRAGVAAARAVKV